MDTETAAKRLTREQIAEQSWAILTRPVSAEEATAECVNCGYGLVELPRPIRVQVAAEGILAGDYLRTEFVDFAHWADDEDRVRDSAEPDFEPCGQPQARECDGLAGTGCDGLVRPGEQLCGPCLATEYGA